LNLTDMETCYKVFKRDVADRIQIKSRTFAVEPGNHGQGRQAALPRVRGADHLRRPRLLRGQEDRPQGSVIALFAIVRWSLFP